MKEHKIIKVSDPKKGNITRTTLTYRKRIGKIRKKKHKIKKKRHIKL